MFFIALRTAVARRIISSNREEFILILRYALKIRSVSIMLSSLAVLLRALTAICRITLLLVLLRNLALRILNVQ